VLDVIPVLQPSHRRAVSRAVVRNDPPYDSRLNCQGVRRRPFSTFSLADGRALRLLGRSRHDPQVQRPLTFYMVHGIEPILPFDLTLATFLFPDIADNVCSRERTCVIVLYRDEHEYNILIHTP
jgi:hypothetical protein